MITEAIAKALGFPRGYLLNEGFQVKCSGIPDTDGNAIDRHLIATLDDHLPGTQAHAIGNSEFTDDMWIIEDAQKEIDWSNPKCQLCGKPLAP